MEVEKRCDLIDAYYGGLDADDPERIVSAFTEDFTYRYPGEDAISGRRAVRDFFATGRPTSDTTHEVARRVHGKTHTTCDGRVTGYREGHGEFESAFAGFFTFDETQGLIESIEVYARR